MQKCNKSNKCKTAETCAAQRLRPLRLKPKLSTTDCKLSPSVPTNKENWRNLFFWVLSNILTPTLLLATFGAWNDNCYEIGPKKSQACENASFRNCQLIKRGRGSPRLYFYSRRWKFNCRCRVVEQSNQLGLPPLERCPKELEFLSPGI